MKKVMNAFMQEFKFYRQIKDLKDASAILNIQNVSEEKLAELKV